jgi:hypothetical protein
MDVSDRKGSEWVDCETEEDVYLEASKLSVIECRPGVQGARCKPHEIQGMK